MKLKWIALFAALLLSAPAVARFPGGGGSVPVKGSPSANTISLTWASPTASSSTSACGTSPGVYTINAVDNGSQTSVTSHSGIVAGLVPSTTYYCQALSGASVAGVVTVTTAALPTSTPITSLTFSGAFTEPVPEQINGDVYANCISNDNFTYVGTDDTGWWGNAGMGTGSSMMVGKFTSESPWTGTNVNTIQAFGGASGGGVSNKEVGFGCVGGGIFVWFNHYNAHSGPQEMTSGQLIVSKDQGATWANIKAPSSPTSGGNTPATDNAGLFNSSGLFGGSNFIHYGADDNTLGPRADNAEAFAYLIGNSGYWNNSPDGNLYLARVPKAFISDLTSTKWQFYKGGADGSLDAAWSSLQSDAVPILTDAGHVGVPSVQYLPDPSLHRYIMMDWYYNYPGGNQTVITDSSWVAREAQFPWGPWTKIDGPRQWTPQGWYYPSILQRTGISATANGTPLTVATTGNFSSCCGPGTLYHFFTTTVVVNTH